MTTYREQRQPMNRERREIAALTESIQERQRLGVKLNEFFCPMCDGSRRRFAADSALWAHIRAVHSPFELYALAGAIGGQMPEPIEEGLIAIANSGDHDEAIRLAEAMLLGERRKL